MLIQVSSSRRRAQDIEASDIQNTATPDPDYQLPGSPAMSSNCWTPARPGINDQKNRNPTSCCRIGKSSASNLIQDHRPTDGKCWNQATRYSNSLKQTMPDSNLRKQVPVQYFSSQEKHSRQDSRVKIQTEPNFLCQYKKFGALNRHHQTQVSDLQNQTSPPPNHQTRKPSSCNQRNQLQLDSNLRSQAVADFSHQVKRISAVTFHNQMSAHLPSDGSAQRKAAPGVHHRNRRLSASNHFNQPPAVSHLTQTSTAFKKVDQSRAPAASNQKRQETTAYIQQNHTPASSDQHNQSPPASNHQNQFAFSQLRQTTAALNLKRQEQRAQNQQKHTMSASNQQNQSPIASNPQYQSFAASSLLSQALAASNHKRQELTGDTQKNHTEAASNQQDQSQTASSQQNQPFAASSQLLQRQEPRAQNLQNHTMSASNQENQSYTASSQQNQSFTAAIQSSQARVGKNPVFFLKTQPSGFFCFFLFFFGFFLPRREGF